MEISTGVWHVLEVLFQASRYGLAVGADPWQFAEEIEELKELGVTNGDLRWLVCQGWVSHAEEVSLGNRARSFRRAKNLRFTGRTCFILTEAGIGLFESLAQTFQKKVPPAEAPDFAAGTRPAPRPSWDSERRELRVGDILVKTFRVPAGNQELVLTALEETGWPSHLDDPLPPRPNLDPKRRLHDTINRLNRHQRRPLLHFRGDGRGTGLHWELRSDTATTVPPHRR